MRHSFEEGHSSLAFFYQKNNVVAVVVWFERDAKCPKRTHIFTHKALLLLTFNRASGFRNGDSHSGAGSIEASIADSSKFRSFGRFLKYAAAADDIP